MATQNISKAIKDLRDTIVGKVPLPNDQVNQITQALLYKFMDDMDKLVLKWEELQHSFLVILNNIVGKKL